MRHYQSGNPTSVCTPINNETLGHNYSTAYQDKESVRPRINCESFIQFKTYATAITSEHKPTQHQLFTFVSISSVASRRYFTSLPSRSGTPHVKECVALAAPRTACPREPRPSLTWASAQACSFEMRLVRSLWESTLSCASDAVLSLRNRNKFLNLVVMIHRNVTSVRNMISMFLSLLSLVRTPCASMVLPCQIYIYIYIYIYI